MQQERNLWGRERGSDMCRGKVLLTGFSVLHTLQRMPPMLFNEHDGHPHHPYRATCVETIT